MSLFFEDFYVGQRWETARRTITSQDIADFVKLFGDANPLHTDRAHAQSKGYRDVIAHGPFRMSLVTGLTSQLGMLNETIIGVVETNWTYKKAVCAGDTIHVELEVKDCRLTSKPTRGIVIREYRAINQDGDVVDVGRLTLLVQARGTQSKQN